MTATDLHLPDGFTAESDMRGGFRVGRAGTFIGAVFPVVVAEPGGHWFARRYSKAAKRCRNQAEAVVHLTQHLVKENP
jgi:hypothetical protein